MCIRDSNNLDKNIKFLGVRDDVPMLLNIFDIFIFPSFYEGLPVTLIEAQASGVKCIISDTITAVSYTHLDVYKRQPQKF